MRAYIKSKNKEFISRALGIPQLRSKLETMPGEVLTEHEVLKMAKELFIEIWMERKELWSNDEEAWKKDGRFVGDFKKLAKICGDEMPSVSRYSGLPSDRCFIDSDNEEFISATLEVLPLVAKLSIEGRAISENAIIDYAYELYYMFKQRHEGNADKILEPYINGIPTLQKKPRFWMSRLDDFLEKYGVQTIADL